MAVLDQLGMKLVGADPTQVEVLWERMARGGGVFSGDAGRIGATALSAVDQALWDLAGKALEVPAWQLMGGKRRDRVRVYANLNRGTRDRSPQGFADAASRAVDAGFSAVKSTPFDEVHWRRMDKEGIARDTGIGIERLEKTREVIGDNVEMSNTLVESLNVVELPRWPKWYRCRSHPIVRRGRYRRWPGCIWQRLRLISLFWSTPSARSIGVVSWCGRQKKSQRVISRCQTGPVWGLSWMLRCSWRTNSKAENRSDFGKNDSRFRDDKRERSVLICP